MEPSDADIVCASVAQPELFETIFSRHHRPSASEPVISDPDAEPTVVIHIVSHDGRWSAASFEHTAC